MTGLEERLRADLPALADAMPEAGRTSFTRQQEPLGLGHAVWCARDIIGNEPFALLLPDMVMQHEVGCLSAMVDLYGRTGGNIISTEEVPWDETHKYGVVVKGEEIDGGFHLEGMVEKPPKGTAPSNLYINGRYILQPKIFELLGTQERGEAPLAAECRHGAWEAGGPGGSVLDEPGGLCGAHAQHSAVAGAGGVPGQPCRGTRPRDGVG